MRFDAGSYQQIPDSQFLTHSHLSPQANKTRLLPKNQGQKLKRQETIPEDPYFISGPFLHLLRGLPDAKMCAFLRKFTLKIRLDQF